MVQVKIVWKSPDKKYLTSIGFIRTAEYLYVEELNHNGDGEVESTITELATSNKQIRELRDFLNNLDLKDHPGETFGYEYEDKKFEVA